jgi:hypothetical protein
MFEATQSKEKTSSSAGIWIGVGVILLIAVGAYFYVSKSAPTATTAPLANTTSSALPGKPDPVHDLRIVNVKMDKDSTGTVAVWSVDIRNLSSSYTYSNIAYQTTYIGGDNSVLLQNEGKVNLSLDPGEEQTTEFRDVLYPSGTAIYKFNVKDAQAQR